MTVTLEALNDEAYLVLRAHDLLLSPKTVAEGTVEIAYASVARLVTLEDFEALGLVVKLLAEVRKQEDSVPNKYARVVKKSLKENPAVTGDILVDIAWQGWRNIMPKSLVRADFPYYNAVQLDNVAAHVRSRQGGKPVRHTFECQEWWWHIANRPTHLNAYKTLLNEVQGDEYFATDWSCMLTSGGKNSLQFIRALLERPKTPSHVVLLGALSNNSEATFDDYENAFAVFHEKGLQDRFAYAGQPEQTYAALGIFSAFPEVDDDALLHYLRKSGLGLAKTPASWKKDLYFWGLGRFLHRTVRAYHDITGRSWYDDFPETVEALRLKDELSWYEKQTMEVADITDVFYGSRTLKSLRHNAEAQTRLEWLSQHWDEPATKAWFREEHADANFASASAAYSALVTPEQREEDTAIPQARRFAAEQTRFAHMNPHLDLYGQEESEW